MIFLFWYWYVVGFWVGYHFAMQAIPRKDEIKVHSDKNKFVEEATKRSITPVHITGEDAPYKYTFVDNEGVLHVFRGQKIKYFLEQRKIKIDDGISEVEVA